MKTLTIFTPTYNRGDILENAYKSLKKQTNKDFIWLIVDDGSTDNTEDIVEKWIGENTIEIKYIKKENGGKHTAYNVACDNTDTELIMIALDSDDYLCEDAVEIIINAWNEHDGISGIVTLCDNGDHTKPVYDKYKIDKSGICSLQKTFAENLFLGEARFTFKTEYAKKYKYPIIEGEKFFTEGYIYYQMDEPMYWINKSTYTFLYRDDGLTKNLLKGFLQNPVSYFLYNKVRVKHDKKMHLLFKHCIYYVAFGILSKQKNIIRQSSRPFLIFFIYPLGKIGSVYLIALGKKKGIEI